MDIAKLIRQIACAICQGTQKSKPQIELLSTTSMIAYVELKDRGIECLRGGFMLDTHEPYYYTKAEDWAEVFDYIYFAFNMPSYIAARMDCDDFAIWMKGLVAGCFGLNYFAIIYGTTPMGYHSWNLFKTDNGLVQFEPQTGKFFGLDEKSYKPEYVLL